MGAMTIVELIDAHDGFEVITSRITTTNKTKLVWLIGIFWPFSFPPFWIILPLPCFNIAAS
jgi:hypothetical protein